MAEAIAIALLPAWQAVARIAQIWYDAIWSSYEDAGMPYGANDEGMWRWARECAKAARLRREAEQIELYHQQMAAFRRMIVDSGGAVNGLGERIERIV